MSEFSVVILVGCGITNMLCGFGMLAIKDDKDESVFPSLIIGLGTCFLLLGILGLVGVL